MESSPVNGQLTELQRAVLSEFFRRERGFFLTGGAALAGYYLGHRRTDDLDLFTTDEAAFSRSRYVMPAVAEALGGCVDVRQDAPDFRRYAVTRGPDVLVVDLVRDRVPQMRPTKAEIDGVLIDSPEEILANKLTALVGRQEERDIVDVYFLEQTGLRVEDALEPALAKDGGCTPATLAWLLSQITIDDGAALPGEVRPEALRKYVSELVRRLRRKGAPAP